MKLSQYLREQPSSYVLLLSLLVSVLIGVLEYEFSELIFSGMYVLPVSLAAVSTGFFGGSFAALFAAAVWVFAGVFGVEGAARETLPYINGALVFAPLALVAWVFSRFKSAYQQAWEQASRDQLTGLFNNDFFLGHARTMFGAARRGKGELSMIALRLHDLKEYRERETITAAETLLVSVAGILRRATRRGDLIGRIAPDSFAIILPRTGAKSASAVLRRLNGYLVRVIVRDKLGIDFGIGCAVFAKLPDSFEMVRDEAFRLAAEALEDSSDESRLRLKIFEYDADNSRLK